MPGEAFHENESRCATGWRTTKTFANVEIVQSTAIAPDPVFPGQTTALRHGHGRTIWDMASLTSFAALQHIEGLATGDTSWIFDA
jgi:hypothetical protein